MDSEEERPKYVYQPSTSAYQRAQLIIAEKRITLIPERQVWIVDGTSGSSYVLQIFRNGRRSPSCTCPATTTCSHILAAVVSVGYSMESSKRPNIEQMRKRSRKGADKTSGRKKPRMHDCEPRPRKQVINFFFQNSKIPRNLCRANGIFVLSEAL